MSPVFSPQPMSPSGDPERSPPPPGSWLGSPSRAPVGSRPGVVTAGVPYLSAGTGVGTSSAPVKIGSGWPVHNLVFPVGDFDGDGLTDLMARGADGTLSSTPETAWTVPVRWPGAIGSGWDAFTAVLSPGDFTGDGIPTCSRGAADGTAYLYRGNGVGGWPAADHRWHRRGSSTPL